MDEESNNNSAETENTEEKDSNKGWKSCMRWTAIIFLILGILILGVGVMNLMWSDSKLKFGDNTIIDISIVAAGGIMFACSLGLMLYLHFKKDKSQ